MGLITWAIPLLLIAIVSAVLDRRLQSHAKALRTDSEATSTEMSPDKQSAGNGDLLNTVETAIADAKQVFSYWYQRVLGGHSPETRQQFSQWLAELSANHSDLKNWLETLPEQELALFIDGMSEFCHRQGFDLIWLMSQKADPLLKQQPKLRTLITQYSQTYRSGHESQQEIRLLKIWQAFDENPYAREKQPFLQNLFVKLVERRLTPTVPQAVLTWPEAKRDIYLVQVVRQVQEQQPDAFFRVLKEVVANGHPI